MVNIMNTQLGPPTILDFVLSQSSMVLRSYPILILLVQIQIYSITRFKFLRIVNWSPNNSPYNVFHQPAQPSRVLKTILVAVLIKFLNDGRRPLLQFGLLSVLACNTTTDAGLYLILGDFSCHVTVLDDGIVSCIVSSDK